MLGNNRHGGTEAGTSHRGHTQAGHGGGAGVSSQGQPQEGPTPVHVAGRTAWKASQTQGHLRGRAGGDGNGR